MNNEKIASLIIQIKEGDETAYEQFYTELWNPLFYYAQQRLHSREDAKDAVQETMISISRNIHKLKNEVAFEAWANRILVSKCKDIYSTYDKNGHVNIDEVDEIFEEENVEFLPEEVLSRQETCKEISGVISQLPMQQNEAIFLYYFQRLSVNEISDIMEISSYAVKQKLYRARKTIKEKVEFLQNQGFVICATPVVPVLTRIFMEEMKTICTPEIGAEMFANIKAALAATAAGATTTIGTTSGIVIQETVASGTNSLPMAATTATHSSTTLTSGLVVKISASILTMAVIGGGVAFYVNNQAVSPPIDTSVVATPTHQIAPTPIVKNIETLEDFVGAEDAKIIQSWSAPSTSNQNDAFMEMVEKHGLQMDSAFVDVENGGAMYAMFRKDEQDMRLLMCEYYDSTTETWAAVYAVEPITNAMPTVGGIKTWFEETQAKLLT